MNRLTLAHLTVFLCLALVTMGIFVATSKAELVWMATPCGEGGSWVEVSTREDAYPKPVPEPVDPYWPNSRGSSLGYVHPEVAGIEQPAVSDTSTTAGCMPPDTEGQDLHPSILPVTGTSGIMMAGAGLFILTGGWLMYRNRGKRSGG